MITLHAYEIDFDPEGNMWEVYENPDSWFGTYSPDEFPAFLDSARVFGYDVKIYTLESWDAL